MLLERLVQEGPDLFGVANRGYSAYMLAGVMQDEVGGTPIHHPLNGLVDEDSASRALLLSSAHTCLQ